MLSTARVTLEAKPGPVKRMMASHGLAFLTRKDLQEDLKAPLAETSVDSARLSRGDFIKCDDVQQQDFDPIQSFSQLRRLRRSPGADFNAEPKDAANPSQQRRTPRQGSKIRIRHKKGKLDRNYTWSPSRGIYSGTLEVLGALQQSAHTAELSADSEEPPEHATSPLANLLEDPAGRTHADCAVEGRSTWGESEGLRDSADRDTDGSNAISLPLDRDTDWSCTTSMLLDRDLQSLAADWAKSSGDAGGRGLWTPPAPPTPLGAKRTFSRYTSGRGHSVTSSTWTEGLVDTAAWGQAVEVEAQVAERDACSSETLADVAAIVAAELQRSHSRDYLRDDVQSADSREHVDATSSRSGTRVSNSNASLTRSSMRADSENDRSSVHGEVDRPSFEPENFFGSTRPSVELFATEEEAENSKNFAWPNENERDTFGEDIPDVEEEWSKIEGVHEEYNKLQAACVDDLLSCDPLSEWDDDNKQRRKQLQKDVCRPPSSPASSDISALKKRARQLQAWHTRLAISRIGTPSYNKMEQLPAQPQSCSREAYAQQIIAEAAASQRKLHAQMCRYPAQSDAKTQPGPQDKACEFAPH